MDYSSVMKRAWEITRRTPALWALGAISAAQAMVYSLVLTMMLVPITVLPQVSTSLSLVAKGTESGIDPFGGVAQRLLVTGSQRLLEYLPAIISIVVCVFAIWVVLGVLDVAAQPAMITVSIARIEGRPVTAQQALRGGFALWWRTAGLLAVAALPSLLIVLGIGVSTLFTYTLPLMRGQMPDPAAGVTTQIAFTPLQVAASTVSVVLSVVVTIALRHALVEGAKLREALGRSWRLVKTNLASVALTYLAATIVAVLVAIVLALATALVGGVGAALVVGGAVIATGSFGAAAWIAGVVVTVLALAVGLVFQAALYAWTSTVWTIAWRNLRFRSVSAET